jgi:hypothetical protein
MSQMTMTDNKRYEEETINYRKGFVEGQVGERDVYMLFTSCTNIDEYNRGFLDGQAADAKGSK